MFNWNLYKVEAIPFEVGPTRCRVRALSKQSNEQTVPLGLFAHCPHATAARNRRRPTLGTCDHLTSDGWSHACFCVRVPVQCQIQLNYPLSCPSFNSTAIPLPPGLRPCADYSSLACVRANPGTNNDIPLVSGPFHLNPYQCR